jgi:hypothetical protein
VSIIAAYVLAFHALLMGIAAAQMVAGDPADQFVICYGSSDTGSIDANDAAPGKTHTHVNHANCAICAFAASVPPVPQSPALAQIAVDTTFSRVARAAAIGIDRHNPRCSQGPPQGA